MEINKQVLLLIITLDNLNTQKFKLHRKPCWRRSKNRTISLVCSEQNLKKFTFILNKFAFLTNFILITALSLFGFELSTVTVIFLNFTCNKVLFSVSWLAILQILFWNLLKVIVGTKKSGILVQFSKKPPYFCHPEVILK